MFFCTLGRRRS